MILNLCSTVTATVEREGSLWIHVPPVAGIAEFRVHPGSVLKWEDGTPAPLDALAPGTRLTAIGRDEGGRSLDVQSLVVMQPCAKGGLPATRAQSLLTETLRMALGAWRPRRPRLVFPIAPSGVG